MIESQEYEVLEKIGHGSFGVIRKVKRKNDGHILCRKEISYIKMSTKEKEQLMAELNILASLRHQNIVAYYHQEHLKESKDLYLYMEYCGGGDLGTVIHKLKEKRTLADEEFVWAIFSQLVTALYRCHYGIDPPSVGANVLGPQGRDVKPLSGLKGKQAQVMILHRDLKPENIFLDDFRTVKLGDFGLSKLMQSHDFASTYVGTPFYMSPEICAAERYTMSSDIWSVGCIMYELCSLEPPFNAKTHIQLVQRIREGKFKELPKTYSPELRAVIGECLKVNPRQRPDTAALLNLPMMRLSRKEKEVVETSLILKSKEEAALLRIKEAEQKIAYFEREKEKMRIEIDAVLRREWELKARLEIDRQVSLELERLRKKFDREVQEKVTTEVDRLTRLQASKEVNTTFALGMAPSSSISTAGEDDFPSSTDISEISMESPELEPKQLYPTKRGAKTPFSRSKTTFDSPMDVQMADPSPLTIASLSLSPRRAAGLGKNIFAEAAIKQKSHTKWEPTMAYSDDEDEIPDLPSPTRPRAMADPLKTRPGLVARQNTTGTMQKLQTQPALFAKGQQPSSIPPTTLSIEARPRLSDPKAASGGDKKRSTPNRRLSKIPSSPNLSTGDSFSPTRKTNTTKNFATKMMAVGQVKDTGATLTTGGDEMYKTVMQRNMNIGGKTLVELHQARAGGRTVGEMKTAMISRTAFLDPPATWDPERDEMPSPFLTRGAKERAIRGLR